uniref:Mitochondrial import receptor subunit TOM40 homolog n=1 Tax=Glossina brevipalpis TaxID=37001 RepID=A0A1A9W496_9MUSC
MDGGRCPPKVFTKFPPCFQMYPDSKESSNPGNMWQLHYLACRLKPKLFGGVVLDYTDQVAPNKILRGSCLLNLYPGGEFSFGGIYTSGKNGKLLQTPTVYADINPISMSATMGFVYFPLSCLLVEAGLQRPPGKEPVEAQTTVEYRGDCSTLTFHLENVRKTSVDISASYLRSVFDHLVLGAELFAEWTQSGGIVPDASIAARYQQDDFSVASAISSKTISVSSWLHVHPKVQVGTLFVCEPNLAKTSSFVFCKWDLCQAYVKAMFNSNQTFGLIYARAPANLPVSMAISMWVNLYTNRFLLGLKLILDPSDLQRDY